LRTNQSEASKHENVVECYQYNYAEFKVENAAKYESRKNLLDFCCSNVYRFKLNYVW